MTAKEIRKHLRVMGVKGENKDPYPVDCWEETEDYWLVPRAWGYARFEGQNKTTKPRVKWQPKPGFKYKHDQKEVVEKAVAECKKNLGCRIECGTGWGKTVSSLKMAEKLNTRTLIIVDQTSLADQWEERYSDFYEGSIGRVQGDTYDIDHTVVIAMAQTLYSRLDALPKKFWSHFGTVICDEAQNLCTKTMTSILSKSKARYRIGVSATWRRTDKTEKIWDMLISPIAIKGKRTDKLKKRYEIHNLELGFSNNSFYNHWKDSMDFNKVLDKLSKNMEYNRWLTEKIQELVEEERQVVVAFARKQQIEYIEEMLDIDCGVFVGSYKGKTLKKDELAIVAGKNPILCTFGKMKKGIDIPRLDTLIIAAPIRDQEQLIGRINRELEGKKECLVIDVRFPEISYLNGQSRNRDKLYKKLGWKIENSEP